MYQYAKLENSDLQQVKDSKIIIDLQAGISRYGLPLQPHRIYDDNCLPGPGKSVYLTRNIGFKRYELKDHLGNVRAVINDIKEPNVDTLRQTKAVKSFIPNLMAYNNYYGFGMLQPGRNYTDATTDYKYGFNGKEADDEVQGAKNSYTAEFWQYDPRLGRRWNIDPVIKPHESPYATFANSPIWFVDPFGNDTLKFTGSEEEVNNILNSISDQFDALLEYNTIYDDNGSVSGVDIYGVSGSKAGDDKKDELRDNLTSLLNTGTDVVNIIKVINTPGKIDAVEWYGGMVYQPGTKSILITDQWFTGKWSGSGMRSPRYDYLVDVTWWNFDKYQSSRIIPFSEALAHELIHRNRHKSSSWLLVRRDEENATISILNNWRNSMGIAERGLTRTANFWEVFFGLKEIEVLKEYPQGYISE